MPSDRLATLTLPKRRNRAVDAMSDGVLDQIAAQTAAGGQDVGGMPATEAEAQPVTAIAEQGDAARSKRPLCRDSPLRRAQPSDRLAVYVPRDLSAKLRQRAAKEHASMSLLVSEALAMYLGG